MPGAALVTGASRGIGAATARLLGQRGYAVCVNYLRDADAAMRVVDAIHAAGGRAVALRADVSDPTEVTSLFDGAEAAFGPLSVLVNNAGVTGPLGPVARAEPAAMRRVIEVNVLGVMYCAREAVRRMARDAGGAIVNVSSGAASLGSPGEFVDYAASKAAVDTFTLGLAKEVAGAGPRVNAVAPGLVDTDLHAAAGEPDRPARIAPTVPMGRAGSAEEIARTIVWLLSDEASYVTGAILRVAGGR